MEVESPFSGTVLRLLASPGDEVAVKTPIAWIGEAGETVPDAEDESAASPTDDMAGDRADSAPRAATPSPAHSPDEETPPAENQRGVSPRARSRAAELGVDARALEGSGPNGRVIERDVVSAAEASSRHGGTGVGGRVTERDRAHTEQRSSPTARTPQSGEETATVAEEIAVTGVRKVIAERMHASLRDTAQLTLHASADARALRRFRARCKSDGVALGLDGVNINDMVMFAVVRTLGDFPQLNSHFVGDTIKRFRGVDLGFAVDTPRGLLVPTVAGADRYSLSEFSVRAKELAGRAIDGKTGTDDLAPATFTVTNLGAFGVERFTPVLNPPQVGILGVGTIELKAKESGDGTVEHIPSIGLSLTIDHRAVDGAPAARFLQELGRRIELFDLLPAM